MANSNRVIVTATVMIIAGLVVTGCGANGNKSHAASPTTTTSGPPTPALTPNVPVTTTTAIGTTRTAASSALPPCRNGQISVTGGGGGAGLGHRDEVLLFTNRSPAACAMSGYPRVAGLDARGDQAVQAQRTLGGYMGGLPLDATSFPNVSLAPGQTASAKVEGTDNPLGSATSCPYYPDLLVTPPNLTDSVRVTVTASGTGGFPGCSPIEVHPVVPGASGDEN